MPIKFVMEDKDITRATIEGMTPCKRWELLEQELKE